MDVIVFTAVITAALLHAAWNALVKGGDDKFVGMTAVVLGHTPIALLVLLFVPAPHAASWPYIAAGIGLHVGYQIVLLYSYRIGDLTQVYPIARGSAPLIVAAISIGFLNVELSRVELIAVLTIGAGIVSMSLTRQKDGLRNGKATLLALATGCFIAGYSLMDGLGARVAGTALGYYAWLTLGNVVVFSALMARIRPDVFKAIPRKGRRAFFLGGGASFLAYSLVVWSFTMAPIALVTALRETSIVFAVLIGVFVLKEKLDLVRVFSTLVTLLGAALLRLSPH